MSPSLRELQRKIGQLVHHDRDLRRRLHAAPVSTLGALNRLTLEERAALRSMGIQATESLVRGLLDPYVPASLRRAEGISTAAAGSEGTEPRRTCDFPPWDYPCVDHTSPFDPCPLPSSPDPTCRTKDNIQGCRYYVPAVLRDSHLDHLSPNTCFVWSNPTFVFTFVNFFDDRLRIVVTEFMAAFFRSAYIQRLYDLYIKFCTDRSREPLGLPQVAPGWVEMIFPGTSIDLDDVKNALSDGVDSGQLPLVYEPVYVMLLDPSRDASFYTGTDSKTGHHDYASPNGKHNALPFIVLTSFSVRRALVLGDFDALTETLTHEIIETITDPFPADLRGQFFAWVSPGSQPFPVHDEIADVCAGYGAARILLDTGTRHSVAKGLFNVYDVSCGTGSHEATATAFGMPYDVEHLLWVTPRGVIRAGRYNRFGLQEDVAITQEDWAISGATIAGAFSQYFDTPANQSTYGAFWVGRDGGVYGQLNDLGQAQNPNLFRPDGWLKCPRQCAGSQPDLKEEYPVEAVCATPGQSFFWIFYAATFEQQGHTIPYFPEYYNVSPGATFIVEYDFFFPNRNMAPRDVSSTFGQNGGINIGASPAQGGIIRAVRTGRTAFPIAAFWTYFADGSVCYFTSSVYNDAKGNPPLELSTFAVGPDKRRFLGCPGAPVTAISGAGTAVYLFWVNPFGNILTVAGAWSSPTNPTDGTFVWSRAYALARTEDGPLPGANVAAVVVFGGIQIFWVRRSDGAIMTRQAWPLSTKPPTILVSGGSDVALASNTTVISAVSIDPNVCTLYWGGEGGSIFQLTFSGDFEHGALKLVAQPGATGMMP